MTKKISESLFTSILYLFSSAMLILSLLMSIKLNAISAQAEKIRNESEALKKENSLLSAKLEGLTGIDALAEYAENAGMIKCSAENVEYLILSDNDRQ